MLDDIWETECVANSGTRSVVGIARALVLTVPRDRTASELMPVKNTLARLIREG